jgi:hypothetical protein
MQIVTISIVTAMVIRYAAGSTLVASPHPRPGQFTHLFVGGTFLRRAWRI